MSILLSAETNAVVKLDLGDKGGTRRVVFSRLWDSEKSQVSFGKLVNLALAHSTLSRPDLNCAVVTYTDVDGDTITISTGYELEEAFEQFMTHPSSTGVTPVVLRVQVAFVKQRNCGLNVGMQRRVERKREANAAMQERTEDKSEDKSEMNLDTNKRGVKWVQLQHIFDSLLTNVAETAEQLANDNENGKKTNVQMQAAFDSLVTKMTSTANKLSEDIEVRRPRKRNDASIDEDVRKRRNPRMQMQHILDSLVTNMGDAVDEMAKDYENSKKTNLEMKAVLDSLVTNMKANIEKLSGDVEVMRPRKRNCASTDEVVNTCDGERPSNRANGWKKRNLLMHDKFDSFVTDMTETVQKLSDLLVVENGNDVDDTSLNDKDTKNTTPNTGQPELMTEDVADMVVAEKLGIVKITNSTSKSSSSAVALTARDDSTRDVAMEGNADWEVLGD